MTRTGVRLGENQPIRRIDETYIRLRIVGQKAGIDCDAAARAVAVPIAPRQAGVGPVDRLLMATSRCKTLRFESAANGHLSEPLVVVAIAKPWPHAAAAVANQLPDYRRCRSGQAGSSRVYRSDVGITMLLKIALGEEPLEDFTHGIWPCGSFSASALKQFLYRD